MMCGVVGGLDWMSIALLQNTGVPDTSNSAVNVSQAVASVMF